MIFVPVIYTDVHKQNFVTLVMISHPNNFDPLLTFNYIFVFIFYVFTPAFAIFLQHTLNS